MYFPDRGCVRTCIRTLYVYATGKNIKTEDITHKHLQKHQNGHMRING